MGESQSPKFVLLSCQNNLSGFIATFVLQQFPGFTPTAESPGFSPDLLWSGRHATRQNRIKRAYAENKYLGLLIQQG
jgi:hypothetical protein